MQKVHTIKGNVKHVDGYNYVIEILDGAEMKLHTDSTTVMLPGFIYPGDRIEATVTEQNHALSMLPVP